MFSGIFTIGLPSQLARLATPIAPGRIWLNGPVQ
jgi:hypothetical protein